MTEPKVFCGMCLRWLVHDQGYCPLFPDVKPPNEYALFPSSGKPGKKWTACCCLTHTCYDARELSVEPDPENAPTYRD